MTKVIDYPVCDREAIGKRIASRRKELNISQSYLASLVSSSQELIAKIEIGQRNIQNDVLIRIAAALDVSTDYILRGIDSRNIKITDDLHLSNEAINNLREYLDSDVLMQLDNAREAVNWILSNRKGFSMIAQLYAYICADCSFVSITGEGNELLSSDSIRIPLTSGVQKDHVSASYHLSREDFSDMLLQKIMFNLKTWKKEMQVTDKEAE